LRILASTILAIGVALAAPAQSESIEVQGSHCGLAVNPAAVYAVADRLAQPEGGWTPFDRSGWRSLIFPDPAR
jgi:hypothetical protein